MRPPRRVILIVWTLAAAAFMALAYAGPQEDSSREPLEKPEIFGEGVISTTLPEFATSFSPDGNTAYFNVANEDRSVLKLVSSSFENGSWSTPRVLPFSDGTYRDVDPFVTTDGSRLYFSSNRPVKEGESKEDFDTWYVERAGKGWGVPINPGAPLNGKRSEVFVSVTQSGTVYFSAQEEGVRAVFRSVYVEGTYQVPERVDLGLAADINVGNPLIARDESFLIIVSRGLTGEGGADLFISRRTDQGTWGKPENLGNAVNSPFADFAPGLSPDGRYLYFTSERPGVVGAMSEGRPPGDLYRVSIQTIGP